MECLTQVNEDLFLFDRLRGLRHFAGGHSSRNSAAATMRTARQRFRIGVILEVLELLARSHPDGSNQAGTSERMPSTGKVAPWACIA